MSIDAADDPVQFDDVTGSEADTFPKPRAHGAAVMNHLSDVADPHADRGADRGTLYDRSLAYWREHVGDRDLEPHVAVDDFEADWLPSGDYALVLTSSRWKAGTGRGDDYRAYYEQHLKLREWGAEDDDGERSLRKPPLALHIEIMPQFREMVYKSGDPLECPYGEGTRLLAWTTWAEDPFEIERRMYDALRAVYGADAVDLDDRVDDARRLPKAEAHIRFDIDRKNAAVNIGDASIETPIYFRYNPLQHAAIKPNMDDPPLDDVDMSILHHLQENARNTITDIANEVGVSGNTVRNRIEELEENDIIKGYSVDIDYKEAGLDLHFAFTCTAPISKREELARDILAIPGVIEVREFMTGQENIYLEALGTDADDITRIAHEIDALGAQIHIEKLIRNDFSKPFGSFSPPVEES